MNIGFKSPAASDVTSTSIALTLDCLALPAAEAVCELFKATADYREKLGVCDQQFGFSVSEDPDTVALLLE